MIIKDKNFPDGLLTIFTDYEKSANVGAEGCFQIVDIKIEENSVLKHLNIDQGQHYHSIKEVLCDLGLNPDNIEYKEEKIIVKEL